MPNQAMTHDDDPDTESLEDNLNREVDRLRRSIVGSPALEKACSDSFDYALKLRTGEVIRFEYARIIDRDWVHLTLMSREDQPTGFQVPYPADRGMDIRISDIVWVMDAPLGS